MKTYGIVEGMAKLILALLIVTSFFCYVSPASSAERLSHCLPPDVTLDSPVVIPQSKSIKEETKTTVRTRLSQLKARCKNSKLLTATGKEIRFVLLLGCWGNPPENYQELFTAQAKEIERLKKKYVVIQIPCGGNVDLRTIN